MSFYHSGFLTSEALAKRSHQLSESLSFTLRAQTAFKCTLDSGDPAAWVTWDRRAQAELLRNVAYSKGTDVSMTLSILLG